MTTTERLLKAAEACQQEAAELARHPADLYPDLDGAIEHVKAGCEMRIRYVLAGLLAAEAARLAATAHPSWHDTVVSPHMLALADAILGAPVEGVSGE